MLLAIIIDINCAVIVVIISFTMDEHSLRIYCALEHMKQVSINKVDTGNIYFFALLVNRLFCSIVWFLFLKK
jgi:hypothetical protein